MKLWCEEILTGEAGAKNCNFLGNDLVISANGFLYPCPMLPQYHLGNVRAEPLAALFEAVQPALAELSAAARHRQLPVCSECCVEKLDLSS